MAVTPKFTLMPDFHFDRLPDQTGRIRPGDVGVHHSTTLGLHPHAMPSADFDAWADYLARWHVPKPVSIKLSAVQNGHIVLMLMEAYEVDASELTPLEIHLRIEIVVPSPKPDENSARWIRALLRWLVCHELDEFVKLDGERVFDPHRHGRTPTPENS